MRVETTGFAIDGSHCAATIYWPEARTEKPPVILMCLGMGGEQTMAVEPMARRFAEMGLAAITFDYRGFGASGGEPRQLITPKGQHADIRAALNFVRNHPELDGARPILWGVSFGGGHALSIAASEPDLRAVVAVTPHTDANAAVGETTLRKFLGLTVKALSDLVGSWFGLGPVYVKLAAKPGELGFLDTEECWDGYWSIVPEGYAWPNRVAARLALLMIAYNPKNVCNQIKVPVLMIGGTRDTLVPVKTVREAASRIANHRLVEFPETHFSIYHGAALEKLIEAQCSFIADQFQAETAARP